MLSKIKNKVRQKLKSFLGLNTMERQLGEILAPDLVRELEARALVSSADLIEKSMAKATAVHNAFAVIDFALGKVSPEQKGLFCEFGVYQGTTINHIARQVKSKVYGFDSFKGLPENWRDGFPAGTFALTAQALPKREQNVEFIVGWFHETLPHFVSQHPEPISFLHIDCDLYSSTKTVFDHLGKQLIPGSVIVFDEYFNYPGWQEHECRAFAEFIEVSGHRFEYLCYNRYNQQVAVRFL